MSERILSFTYLMCSSGSEPKTLKKCLRFAKFNFSEKLHNIFKIGLKIWSVRTKIAVIEKIFRKKKFADMFRFCCLCVNLLTVKIWGNRTNSLWVWAFYGVCFKWKNWFEKTALNMSIRRLIFTSGQNLKPPFLCQYLIFLNDSFFTLETLFGSIL